MSGRRGLWLVFALCVLGVSAALGGTTWVMLRLEARERAARADADHQAALRLALWQLDSWLGARLTAESARSAVGYLEHVPPAAGPDPFPFRFQWSDAGLAMSPADAALQRVLDSALRSSELQAEIPEPSSVAHAWGVQNVQSAPGRTQEEPRGDRGSRMGAINAQVHNGFPTVLTGGVTMVGPFVATWIGRDADAGDPLLVFVRRMNARGSMAIQGFLADWRSLRAELLGRVSALFPLGRATLRPVENPTPDQEDRMLAAIPALLAAEPSLPLAPAWSRTRGVLAVAWLAMVLAATAVGVMLRSALSFGDRRARFALAVGHELRTPLTTFRMYSQMLAEGMVRDETERAGYLETLRREADRLSRLVENVLCHARLEEGRFRARPERVTAGELLDRLGPELAERAAQAGMELRIDDASAGEIEVEVDVDAVSQVLFNLVDNACKYARASTPPVIELLASAEGARLALRVRDHGPGISTAHAKKIFRPFERGVVEKGRSDVAGIGLGLSLARGLARDMGGDLVFEPVEGGACFALVLPRAPANRAEGRRRAGDAASLERMRRGSREN